MLIELVGGERSTTAIRAQLVDHLGDDRLQRNATSLIRDHVITSAADLDDISDLQIKCLHRNRHVISVAAGSDLTRLARAAQARTKSLLHEAWRPG